MLHQNEQNMMGFFSRYYRYTYMLNVHYCKLKSCWEHKCLFKCRWDQGRNSKNYKTMIYFLSHTSWIAFMTTCCTDSSIDMILPMYSSLLAQLTAQPRISWRRRPNSHLSFRSPLHSHKQVTLHITTKNRITRICSLI